MKEVISRKKVFRLENFNWLLSILNKYILVHLKSIYCTSILLYYYVAYGPCVRAWVCTRHAHFHLGFIHIHILTWLRSRTHILRLSAFKNTFARNRPAERACMHSVIIMTYVVTLQNCKLVATFFPCLLLYFFHHFRFFRLF